MANVIDVSASGKPDAAVLTATAKSGMLGGTYLRSKPLAAYLADAEVPHYVVRNKKSGLRIEAAGDADPESGNRASETAEGPATAEQRRDDAATVTDGTGAPVQTHTDETSAPEHLEPASEYQALAAVTDVRIVFVVGTADRDRSASIPLSDVATVDVESGLLGGELAITTVRNDRYVFPCRGDLAPIAEYVDRGAQAWARAYSLLDDARASLQAAERHRDATEFAAAIEAIDEAVDAVAAATDRMETFGEGAANSLGPETEELRRTLERRRREIYAEHGVHAHEQARSHWGNRNYERAHEAFVEARTALERAQELEATGGIEDRLARIDDELDDLADAPLSYASAMVEEAEDSDDARTSAQCWEVAIERYRDVYALDWAREEDERFRGDPATIRDRIRTAVDELVASRVAGVEDRLEEAEWLRQSDDVDGAREVLDDATAVLDRTETLVEELTHETYPELDRARREVEADRQLLPDP